MDSLYSTIAELLDNLPQYTSRNDCPGTLQGVSCGHPRKISLVALAQCGSVVDLFPTWWRWSLMCGVASTLITLERLPWLRNHQQLRPLQNSQRSVCPVQHLPCLSLQIHRLKWELVIRLVPAHWSHSLYHSKHHLCAFVIHRYGHDCSAQGDVIAALIYTLSLPAASAGWQIDCDLLMSPLSCYREPCIGFFLRGRECSVYAWLVEIVV